MKPIADFDWKHPKTIDRTLVDDLFELQFMRDHVNIVLLGPNGVGKHRIQPRDPCAGPSSAANPVGG